MSGLDDSIGKGCVLMNYLGKCEPTGRVLASLCSIDSDRLLGALVVICNVMDRQGVQRLYLPHGPLWAEPLHAEIIRRLSK